MQFRQPELNNDTNGHTYRFWILNPIYFIDFDGDGKITASDIERVVRQLCGNEQFSRNELDKIIYHVRKMQLLF